MLSRERINDSRETFDNGRIPDLTAHCNPNYGDTNHTILNAFGPANTHRDIFEKYIGPGSWDQSGKGSKMTAYNSILAGALYLRDLNKKIKKRGVCPDIPTNINREDAAWIEAIVRYNIGEDTPYGGWGPYSMSVQGAYEQYAVQAAMQKYK